MANQEQLALLRQGVRVWNAWRQAHPDVKPELQGANLEGANLERADLERADLERADLERADLEGADLEGANLREAFLFRANLQGAFLFRANLEKANLEGAKLQGANLEGAKLQGANLEGGYTEASSIPSKLPIMEPAPVEPAPAHLNTRFDGIDPDTNLTVGSKVVLSIWVGATQAKSASRSSEVFKFNFPDTQTPVIFDIQVRGDPEMWEIKAIEPTLIVAPPGRTIQEAEFRIISRLAGRDKLLISVMHRESGASVQDMWLPVTVAPSPKAGATPGPAPTLPDATPVSFGGAGTLALPAGAVQPDTLGNNSPDQLRAKSFVVYQHNESRTTSGVSLDARSVEPRTVKFVLNEVGASTSEFIMHVDASLNDRVMHNSWRVPISREEINNTTLRIRQELDKIVGWRDAQGQGRFYPLHTAATGKAAALELAFVGQQYWRLLFAREQTPHGLQELGEALRKLPHGSSLRICLDNNEVIVPWALLYDKPGPVTEETLDWSGFWGYRFIIDVIPPRTYPEPVIKESLLAQLVFADHPELQSHVDAQAQLIPQALGIQPNTVRGLAGFVQMLESEQLHHLLYCLCHGSFPSPTLSPGSLPTEAALYFSPNAPLRLADFHNLTKRKFKGDPLIFLNACESAMQEAFYSDGFMRYFLYQREARAFIGTEVKVPVLFAHDFAIEFMRAFGSGEQVGRILWHLRRQFLDQYHTLLGFTYTLYGYSETRREHVDANE